jgi:putative intracellular protease/amidase
LVSFLIICSNKSSKFAAPKKFGLLLYPGFEVLDVFGPLEALNVISRKEFQDKLCIPYAQNVTLSIISQTLEPVSPATAGDVGSVLAQNIIPHFTIQTAPDLDVLLIPGGLGSDGVDNEVIEWVRQTVPNLQYLITICTGADIAARAGVLKGLRATTNKQAWVS